MVRVPTKKEMMEAISQSGYMMEQELVPVIESFGYFVTPNANFKDQDTGQSRGIDIEAISSRTIARGKYDFIFPILLIECKNNSNPYVFFTRKNVLAGWSLGDHYISGMPKEVETTEGLESLTDYVKFNKFHHYSLADQVSSQFCTFEHKQKDKKDTWQAKHDPFYESVIIPIIKALKAAIDDHESSYEPDPSDTEINLQLYYPIIVFGGDLYEIPVEAKTETIRKVKHINFVRHYESESISGTFQIDVITRSYLKKFLELIDEEIDIITRRIKARKKILKANVIREVAEIIAKDNKEKQK